MKIYGGSLISDPKNIEKVGNFYKEMWLKVCIYFWKDNFDISNLAIKLEAIVISYYRS